MDSFEKMLYWLIGGTRGGKNRMRIIQILNDNPMNANELSKELELDYKTVRHHLSVMKENEVVTDVGDKYGKNYFITNRMENNMEKLEEIAEEAGVNQ